MDKKDFRIREHQKRFYVQKKICTISMDAETKKVILFDKWDHIDTRAFGSLEAARDWVKEFIKKPKYYEI